MKKNIEQIEIRSEKIQQVLNRIPSWITRWGITIILTFTIMILVGSWYFKYPEVIRSEITVTTENPPAIIISRAEGHITQFFVKDKQKVTAGQHLSIIENPAQANHIFELQENLDSFQHDLLNFNFDSQNMLFQKNYLLGEIQPAYTLFLKYCKDYLDFISINYYEQKITSLNKEKNKHTSLIRNLTGQISILKKEYNLEQKQFDRNKELFSKSLISEAEFDNYEKLLLQKKHQLEQSHIDLTNAEIEKEKIEQEILNLKLKNQEETKNFQLKIQETYNNLKAEIASWKQKYLLKSPYDGIVSFTKYWSENQYVKTGDIVMTVVPEQPGEIIGKIDLTVEGAGKVDTGQLVNITFKNYPYMEYGMVLGKIKNLSLVPTNDFYTVEVTLTKGLITNYGKTLEFDQEMKGNAEIITNDISLIERIINPLKYLIKKHKRIKKRVK